MTTPAISLPKRLDALTGLRWWAAFGVFIYHMPNFAPLPKFGGIQMLGYLGVMFFFILSGFVLTYSAPAKMPATTFYWRRFSRIWPANFVALLIAIPVFYSFAPNPDQWWVKPVSIPILLLSIPIIQGWWRNPEILFSGNPASWTLTVEFFFYALHPWLNRLLRLLQLRGTFIAATVVWLLTLAYTLLVWLVPGLHLGLVPLPIARVGEFALGMSLAHAVRLGYVTRVASWIGFTLVGVLALGLAASITFQWQGPLSDTFTQLTSPLFLLLFTLIIGTVAAREISGKKSVLSWRPLVILGEWSFAFYLVHGTCVYLALEIFGHQASSWMNLGWYVALLLASLVLAGALHLLVEKPLEKRLRRWWDRRHEQPVTAVASS